MITNQTTMDFSFIVRTLKTCGLLSLLVLLFGSWYYGFVLALAIFTGIIWGMVNLYFLSLLVRATLGSEGVDKTAAIVLLVVKFPLLYAAGYFLIVSDYFDPLLLVIGFTVVLAVIVLKAAGRALLGLDGADDKKKQEDIKSV